MEKHYKALRLKPGATPEQVRDAYRKMAKLWHPDRFVTKPHLLKKAQEKMREVNEAYEVLKKQTAAAPGTGAFSYRPRYRYGPNPTPSPFIFKQRKAKRRFPWKIVRNTALAAAAAYFLFAGGAAPLRQKAADYLKGYFAPAKSAEKPKEIPRAPRPAQAPAPQNNAPQSAPPAPPNPYGTMEKSGVRTQKPPMAGRRFPKKRPPAPR